MSYKKTLWSLSSGTMNLIHQPFCSKCMHIKICQHKDCGCDCHENKESK